MGPSGWDATPHIVSSIAIARSGRPDLGFFLEHAGKEDERCFIDVSNKRTPPEDVIVDGSGRSVAFISSLTLTNPEKNSHPT
jgi:hypothetical protein